MQVLGVPVAEDFQPYLEEVLAKMRAVGIRTDIDASDDRFPKKIRNASKSKVPFTLIAGAIWARQAWGSYWNWDPKETWTFVIWVVYAAYLHARATGLLRRRDDAAIDGDPGDAQCDLGWPLGCSIVQQRSSVAVRKGGASWGRGTTW
mgnify:CR=1 FL=1